MVCSVVRAAVTFVGGDGKEGIDVMVKRDDENGGDVSKRILLAWGEQKSLRQIARELKLDLKFVKETLKREQKKLFGQGGQVGGGGSDDE